MQSLMIILIVITAKNIVFTSMFTFYITICSSISLCLTLQHMVVFAIYSKYL